MCINIMTHHGCFHPVFTSTKTELECSDTIHKEVVHEYTEDVCPNCLDDHPERFQESERKLVSLFETRCLQPDQEFLNSLLEYFRHHSWPGHECLAPHHCYAQSPEIYYHFCRRPDYELDRIPPWIFHQIFPGKYRHGMSDTSSYHTSTSSRGNGKRAALCDDHFDSSMSEVQDDFMSDRPGPEQEFHHSIGRMSSWASSYYEEDDCVQQNPSPTEDTGWWDDSVDASLSPNGKCSQHSRHENDEIPFDNQSPTSYEEDGFIYWDPDSIDPGLVQEDEEFEIILGDGQDKMDP